MKDSKEQRNLRYVRLISLLSASLLIIMSMNIRAQPVAEGFDHHHPEGIVLADGDKGEKIFRTRASRFAWGGHCQDPGTSISFGTRNTETYIAFNRGAWMNGNYIYSRFDSDTEPPSGANEPARTIDMSGEGSQIILSLFESTSNLNASVLVRDKDSWWRSYTFTIVKYQQRYNTEKRIFLDPGQTTWIKLKNTEDMDQVDDGGDTLLVDGEEGTPDWSSIEGMGIMARINIAAAQVFFCGMSLTDGRSGKVDPDEPFRNSDVAFLHKPTPLEKYDVYGGAKVVYWSQGWNKDYTALSQDYGVRDMPAINISVMKNVTAQADPGLKASICRNLWGNEVTIGHPMFPNGVQAQMCIRKEAWKDYIYDYARRRVYDVGARGAILDSPLGSNGSKMLYRDAAGCFCDDCNEGFTEWLKEHYSTQELADMGIDDVNSFSYRDYLKARVSGLTDYIRKFDRNELSFMDLFIRFQETPARDFFTSLRDHMYSVDSAFMFTSNTYNLQQPLLYLVDEIHEEFHGAEAEIYMKQPQRFGIHMQRLKLADALGIRIVSSGGHWNWEYARSHNLVNVIKPIIAAHYASGHQLAVPDNYRWIEPDWYGSMPDYAPFYRFVREHPHLFDDYVPVEQIGLVMDNRVRGVYNGDPVFKGDYEDIGRQLIDHTIPYGVAAGADGIYLTREFTKDELLERFEMIILPRNTQFEGSQLAALAELDALGKVYNYEGDIDALLSAIDPWVSCDREKIWVLPRVHVSDTNAPVIVHLLNRDISIYGDLVTEKTNIQVSLSGKLIKKPVRSIITYGQGQDPYELEFVHTEENISIEVPYLHYWNILKIDFEDSPVNAEKTVKPEPDIYPNPARDHFFIRDLMERTCVRIRTLKGELVFEEYVDNDDYVDISDLQPGFYLVEMKNPLQLITKKLIHF